MQNILKFVVSIILLLSLACNKPHADYISSMGKKYLGMPIADIEKETKALLNAWYPVLIDTINGGYWTNIAYNWQLLAKQNKMLVTQGRGLWTASKAALVFPDNPLFKKAADHGFLFLTEHMWDEQNQGFYQYYDLQAKSGDADQVKSAYGNAFALYALSEYAKINKNPLVLDWVQKTFLWLEHNAHDPQYKGYYNAVLPDNAARDNQSFYMGSAELKDQNSSIHLMEAFSNALLVWPDEHLRKRLQEIFLLVRDTMINEKGSLNLFFSKEWFPVSHALQSRDYILENIYSDHVSFGHNIETGYLLLEASKVLYGKADSLTIQVARGLVDHTLDNGFDINYYGLWDKGYYFTAKTDIEIVNDDKVWWAQAEAWHTLALFSEYFPDNKRYPQACAAMWTYITEQLIDQQYGGWYNNGLDSDPGNASDPKGHQWKGCYHDGRALMQVYQYAQKKKP